MTTVRDVTIKSVALDEQRMVSVFLPPGFRPSVDYPVVFCADGQALRWFAQRLADAMDQEDLIPSILVGAHSNGRYRAEEYIHGVNNHRFAAHEQFFSVELYNWIMAEFGLTITRDSCAVFGFSNGAAFALSLAVRYRDKYGAVIAFSIAGGPDRVEESEYSRRPIARYYISSGTREKPICKTGRALAKILGKHGVDYACTERCAGHDIGFWTSELPSAIRWSFPQKQTK